MTDELDTATLAAVLDDPRMPDNDLEAIRVLIATMLGVPVAVVQTGDRAMVLDLLFSVCQQLRLDGYPRAALLVALLHYRYSRRLEVI